MLHKAHFPLLSPFPIPFLAFGPCSLFPSCAWPLVEVGDHVEQDEAVITIETDKVRSPPPINPPKEKQEKQTNERPIVVGILELHVY